LVNETVLGAGNRTINWTELVDGNYYYNVTVCDVANQCNSTEAREIKLDKTGPVINIINPEARTYTNNNSIPVNVSVYDVLSGLGSCWWNLNGGENQDIVCGENTTFGVELDGAYTFNFFSNDSLGNEGNSSVIFYVSANAPAVTLEIPENNFYFNYSQNINFSFTPRDKDGLSTCQLWGNWSNGWHLNQSRAGIENYSINSFYVNITEGEGAYVWNVLCNDSMNSRAFAPENYTFTLDFTYPQLEFGEGTEEMWEQEKENLKLSTVCPECKTGNLTIKFSPRFRSYFIACSNYPNCKKTYSLPSKRLIKKSELEKAIGKNKEIFIFASFTISIFFNSPFCTVCFFSLF
jgi:hypothetical protein